MEIITVARICHELNRAYSDALGEATEPWWNAPDWQRKSAINGVRFHLNNPNAGPAASHQTWMKEKIADGWTYGPEKDAEKKTHTCLVPFDDLPLLQRIKDVLFTNTVAALAPLIEKEPSCNAND